MPVVVDRYPCADAALQPASGFPSAKHLARHRGGLWDDPSRQIDIGLVNNMPDAAMEATVRQFLSVLESAAQGVVVRLRLYSLPGVPSSEWRHQHISACYSDFNELWDSRLDGLIVTGTEPRAADLTAEPYWADLAKLIDWAEEHATATVWSCLAAHAAVLHLDGIRRSPLPDKCFGLFAHARMSDHGLLRGQPAQILTPHSRWNEISEETLVSSGYRVLSKSPAAGVDIFVKEQKSLFLFFQGHPEYEADTLAREYRRDVARFMRGERDHYPNMPMQYFDPATVEMLNAFRTRALAERREELMSAFPTERAFCALSNTWHLQAVCTYANWLSHIAERKAMRAPLRRTGRTPADPPQPPALSPQP